MLNQLSSEYNPRKLRLFVCACWRQVWQKITDKRARNCVLVAERYADGMAGHAELASAFRDASSVSLAACVAYSSAWSATQELAWRISSYSVAKDRVALLRDIAGNPFRPLIYPCCEGVSRIERVPGDATTLEGGQCPRHGRTWSLKRVPWLTETVLSLAKAAYDERSRQCERCRSKGRWWRCPCCKGEWAGDVGPDCFVCGAPALTGVECDVCRGAGRSEEGALEPARLAVLADALEEAGCTALPLLEHLRSPGPHVRGCWALDLILGRA
jgi:hypothetical protein